MLPAKLSFRVSAGLSLGNISLAYLRDQVGMVGAMKVHAALAFLVLALTLLFFRHKRGKDRASV